jgi:heme-degrading monooxygenase HmoA
MFARIVRVRARPGAIARAAPVFHDAIAPHVRARPGFVSFVLLRDRAGADGMTIGLWESRAMMLVGEEGQAHSAGLAAVLDVLDEPPLVEHLDVLAFVRAPRDPSHFRVVRARYLPGMLERAARLFRDVTLPAARAQPGFLGALLAVDPNRAVGLGVTAWATETDLLAGEENGYFEEQRSLLARFLAAPLEHAIYQLSFRVTRD